MADTATTTDFTITQQVLDTFPELVSMLKASESIEIEEKQYWFDSLETMDEDQIQSLRDILEDEKKQLAELEENYQEKSEEEQEEARKTQEEEARKQREIERKAQEKINHEQDEDQIDDLLSQLNDL